jgi:hypothetical protein
MGKILNFLLHAKMKKSIFSIENAFISQLIQLDKLISRQGLKCKTFFFE